jgi:hypothetical protein
VKEDKLRFEHIDKGIDIKMNEVRDGLTEAEKWAKRFHELYEEFAPKCGYETRKESAVAWENVPLKNKNLMIMVCVNVVDEIKSLQRKELAGKIPKRKEIAKGNEGFAYEQGYNKAIAEIRRALGVGE